MKRYVLTLMITCIFGSIFGQKELEINFDKIKATIENIESVNYYPKLLKRYNDFDSTLTTQDYSMIYYGFSFQDNYIKNQPDEKILNNLSQTKDYKKIIAECQKILDKNPVSLNANNQMGYALFNLGRPASEWKKYQNRYRAFRKVIVYSGNGLSTESAFKVIYVSDEYDILYKYFDIEKIQRQTLVGMSDKFEITPTQQYNSKEMYFDISQKLKRQQYLGSAEKLNKEIQGYPCEY